jgi:hypothetical protein
VRVRIGVATMSIESDQTIESGLGGIADAIRERP